DTTGVEPDIALVKYKKLVGGGMLKLVNGSVPSALRRLGYSETASGAITTYIEQYGTIEGAPALKDEDLAVFDRAFKTQRGGHQINHRHQPTSKAPASTTHSRCIRDTCTVAARSSNMIA